MFEKLRDSMKICLIILNVQSEAIINEFSAEDLICICKQLLQ